MELVVKKLEHDDHIQTLRSQREEYGDEIDLHMLDLEIAWRSLEVKAIEANIEFLRYKQDKLDILRKPMMSFTLKPMNFLFFVLGSTHEQMKLNETIEK